MESKAGLSDGLSWCVQVVRQVTQSRTGKIKAEESEDQFEVEGIKGSYSMKM